MTEAGQILDSAQVAEAPQSAPAPQTPQAPKDESIAPKLSILMERERQAVNRERLAKAQEEKLRERLIKVEQFESVKTDPKKALEFLGLSYDQLTESILKDGETPPSVEIQRLRDELDQLKGSMKQERDLEAESRKTQVLQAESKAVNDFKTEIGDFLKNNASRYELIDFEQAGELVYDVVDEYYNRTVDPQSGVGKVMSIAEACDKVEEHLEKKYLAARDKNKVKAFWSNMPKQIQEQLKKQETEPTARSQPPKTLTNNMGPRIMQKSTRPSEDQRIKQIVDDQVAKMRSQFA